jgi:hypothetical protein
VSTATLLCGYGASLLVRRRTPEAERTVALRHLEEVLYQAAIPAGLLEGLAGPPGSRSLMSFE